MSLRGSGGMRMYEVKLLNSRNKRIIPCWTIDIAAFAQYIVEFYLLCLSPMHEVCKPLCDVVDVSARVVGVVFLC